VVEFPAGSSNFEFDFLWKRKQGINADVILGGVQLWIAE
jgi:hypothetical protein